MAKVYANLVIQKMNNRIIYFLIYIIQVVMGTCSIFIIEKILHFRGGILVHSPAHENLPK